MKQNKIFVISLIATLMILITSTTALGVDYREAIDITTDGTSTPANHPLLLNITYVSEMQSDFDDIRFANSSNGSLAYWIQDKVDSNYANVWVNLSDAITSPGSDTIYMDYGNATFNSESNISNTFVFADDFNDGSIDSTKWTNSSNVVESGGVVTVTGTGSRRSIFSIPTFGINTIFCSRASMDLGGYGDSQTIGYGHEAFDGHEFNTNFPVANNYFTNYNGQQTYTNLGDSYTGFNNWEIRRNGTTSTIFLINGSIVVTEGSSVITQYPSVCEVHFTARGNNDLTISDWVFVRENIVNEPISSYYLDSLHYNATVPYNHTIRSDGTLGSSRSIIASDDTNWTANSTGTTNWVFTTAVSPLGNTNFTLSGDALSNFTVTNLNASLAYNLTNSSRIVERQTTDSNGNATFEIDLTAGDYWITSLYVTEYLPPDPVNLANSTTNLTVNYTWSPGFGYATDSYNVSYNETWDNSSSSTFRNEFVGNHGYLDIIIYAYNNTGNGTLSAGYITDNVTALNDPIIISNISTSYSIDEGDTLYIDANYIDGNDDIGTFADNSTEWSVNNITGIVSWITGDGDGGNHLWYINVTDGYGSTDTQAFSVSVSSNTTPPAPINIANTTGTDWINHTWNPGSGNVTDSYNVSVNGTWHNTSDTFFNDTYSLHEWQNTTVYAYNSSVSGRLSTISISQNTQVPNRPVTITNTSDWNGTTGDNVYVDYDSTDDDSDTPIFSCSHPDFFTDFDTSTGKGNWTVTPGIHNVDFGVSDGYGSTDNYTMTITAISSPADPTNLTNTSGGLWINHTWDAPATPDPYDRYIIRTKKLMPTSEIDGLKWSDSAWTADTDIMNGIPAGYSFLCPAPETFYLGGAWYLVVVFNQDNTVLGYKWNGTGWEESSVIVNGISIEGAGEYTLKRTDVFGIGSTTYMILSIGGNNPHQGYTWNGTGWDSNSSIVSGITTGDYTKIQTYEINSEYFAMIGADDLQGTPNQLEGYKWSGTTWIANSSITNGISGVSGSVGPHMYEKDGSLYAIFTGGHSTLGFVWNGTGWDTDTAMINGITTAPQDGFVYTFIDFSSSPPSDTDSYNISVNDVWYNDTTDLFYNNTQSPHGWQNITVWAYNSSGAGRLSAGSISENKQIPNNIPVLSNVSSSYNLYENETFSLDASHYDVDSDTIIYTDNASEWNINSSTGEVSWVLDWQDVAGSPYAYRITINDGEGGTDHQDFTVTINGMQNTALTSIDTSFESGLPGTDFTDNTISLSFYLVNSGSVDADISAKFTTNYGATYGLVNGTSTIGGSNFKLGNATLDPLFDTDTSVDLTDNVPGEETTLNYNVQLRVPAGQASLDYSGTIELTFSDVT